MRKSNIGSISEYCYEIESRDVIVITHEVIEFKITPKTQIKNFPRNSIWIIISKPFSTIISELIEIISKKDFDRFDFLVNVGFKAFKTIEKSFANKSKPFNLIQEISVLAEVYYESKIISKYLFLFLEQNYIFTFVPYYGGNLSAKDFRISQYFKYGFVKSS